DCSSSSRTCCFVSVLAKCSSISSQSGTRFLHSAQMIVGCWGLPRQPLSSEVVPVAAAFFFQPCIESLHCHLAVTHWCAAVWADVVAEPYHLGGFLQQVFVDVFAEDDLFFHRDGGIEINLQLACTFRPAGQLHTQLFPGKRLEVGSVTPELILLEWPRVMQLHHLRGVNVVEETVEAIAHQHSRMPHQLRAFTPVIDIIGFKCCPRSSVNRKLAAGD